MKKFLLKLTAALALLPMLVHATPSAVGHSTANAGYGTYYYANAPVVTQVPLVAQTRPNPTPMLSETTEGNRETLTLTVNEGTETSSYVPIYGLYADYGAKSQFIIPSSSLSAISAGNTITMLKFYSSATSSTNYFGTTASVKVKEVSNTTFNSAEFVTTGLTTAYSGSSLSRSNDGTMVVTFSNAYTYNGGNLLVSIEGYGEDYSSTSWYGVNKTDASVYGYSSYSNAQTIPTTANKASFAPKVTITYSTSGDGGGGGGTEPEPGDCVTEDFSGVSATGSSTNGNVPTGWKAYAPGYTGSAGYVPHVVNNSTYADITGNDLFFKAGDDCNNVYAIMPKYEGITSVSFKYVYESTSYGTLYVGYVTENTSAGCSNFVSLATLTATTTTSTYTLTESQINTLNNANGYIAFKWYKTGTWYSAAIDDVEVCTGAGAYTVTCATTTGGTITATPTQADEGETITVTATPDAGYTFTSMSYTTDGGTTVAITGNTFSMPADNVTVNAVFTANTSYTITYNASPAGTGTATGPATAPWGSSVTISTSPASGYAFDHMTVTGSGGDVTATGKTFTMPAYNVTVTAYFVEGGGNVTLDDREDHRWVYYTDSESPVHKLNPADIRITYYGEGTNNMTSTSTDNMPSNSAFNADASGVAVNVGTETETTFVYYKTLENANDDGTGNYPYTMIPNPFQVRPTYGTGTDKYRGFYAWRVKSLSNGLTIKSANGSTTYGVNSFIYPEEEIQFVTSSAYDNEVEFEALWAQAYVNSTSSSERATNSGRYQNAYERNFKVVTSLTTYTYPVTISTINPDGTGTVGSITASSDYSCTEDVKLENMKLSMSNYYLNGNGYNFAIGRGVKNGNSNVATAVYGDNTTSSSTSDFTLRVESGQYTNIYGLLNSSTSEISSSFTANMIIGSDYDRAYSNNSNLVVKDQLAVGSRVSTTSSSAKVNLWAYSGKFGANSEDVEFYCGFQNHNDKNCLAPRSIEIYGGEFLGGIAGGIEYGVSSSTNILRIRFRGGTVNQYLYGAGQYSKSYGNRTIVITGGTFNGWIAAGCYGTESSGGATSGDTYLYFGGNATQTNTEGIFGAGYGNYATGTDYYTVVKSHVVVADDSKVSGNVYAGGNNGYTTGDAEVYVKGTNLLVAGNVFGGANKARSSAKTFVTMKGGAVQGNIYGGANTSGTVSGVSSVKISGGTVNGNVFGGGCGASTTMSSKATVEISSIAFVEGNVFGGGELGKSTSSVVNIYGGTVGGNVFGGALGTSGSVMMTSNKTVNMMGGTVRGSVYGGSRNANDSKDNYVNISGGTVIKNVYGGGFFGSITGNTYVNIGKKAIQTSTSSNGISGGTNSDKLVASVIDKIEIGESVYSGSDWGEFTAGSSFMAANISGVSNIFIDGENYADDKIHIGNSIYGSGTSGDAGATANDVVIRNFGTITANGTASQKLFTIQRVGNLVLDNTHIEFIGKGDIVSPTTTKTYAMININKHLIVANASSLVLDASIEKTHSMGSYSCTDAYTLDTVSVNYNGLNACDNKIYFNNGCYVNINYDKNGVSTYGRLTGFFHATSEAGHSGFAFARPKVNNNSGDYAYAGWGAYAPINTTDGGFVSYTASENSFNSIGGYANNGVQIPYKHHPTNRDDSPFYRIWTTGTGITNNDVVITAVASGENSNIITTSASTELPRISSNDGCSYYRITNIEWSDAADFVNAGIYNNVPQYGHIFYDGTDITLSYGQTAAQCSQEIARINANPNYTFGLTMVPTNNITFTDTDGSTVPAIVLSEDGEEYYSTTGNEIKMYTDTDDQAKSKVTFILTYSNSIVSTQTFSPVILTIEEVDCTTGNVLMVLNQSINIQTSTKIQDVEATVYARMYGNGTAHDSTTVKVVLPTWTLTSGEEYSILTVQNITNTPVATGASRHAATYFNNNTGTTNDFGMTYKPTKENDNTLGWMSSTYLTRCFDNHTVALPAELGRADGREQVAINFTVHYNGQAHHNEAEDELSKQIYRITMTNYEGGTKEFNITVHIRRRGQAQNWYISSNGSNANNGQYPDKPKRSIKALQSSVPSYVSGDNIFVVGAVNINAASDWDGSFYDNEMRIYRYPGNHELSTGVTDGANPYLGTMFNINNKLTADYVFIDGMYGCTDTELNPGGNLTLTAQGTVLNITSDGSLVFSDGSISNNHVASTDETAGAILLQGNMTVAGEVVMESNALNNVNCNIVITDLDNAIGIDTLYEGSHIGVTKNTYSTGCEFTPVAYSIEEDTAVAATTFVGDYFFADNNSFLYYNSEETECTNPYTIYIGVSDLYETACDSYEWNGEVYTASGDYVYTSPATGVSTTLHLTINNSAIYTYDVEECNSYTWIDGVTYTESTTKELLFPGAAANGCDSIVTLNLTINYSNTGFDTQIACNSYTWIDGVTYTESNSTATFTLPNQYNCDSVVTLNLTINSSFNEEFDATSCDSYTWNDSIYTATGDYVQQFTSADNCDSTVTLHLTINNSMTDEFNAVACDSYTWNETEYTVSGDYEQQFTTVDNCDSTVTLHLTINSSFNEEFNATSCDSYTWNDSTYTVTGDYVQQFTSVDNCDSTVTLHLTINNSEDNTYNISSCENFVWHGESYTESGTYYFDTITAQGCDLHETLNLTISNIITNTVDVEACETYTWEAGNGETYTESGTHSFTFLTEECDSTIVLNLTIHHNETTEPVTATSCGSYEWNGTTYTESGTYTYETPLEAGCTKTETLVLTIYENEFSEPEVVSACESYEWYDETYTENGTYTHETELEGGCIGVETLELTIHHNESVEPEVVQACVSYTWNGTTYTESGTYTYETPLEAGCTKTETLELTINETIVNNIDVTACDNYVWNNTTYIEDGDYSQTLIAANGCDSIVNIHLTLTSSVTSEFSAEACDNYIWNNLVYGNSGDFNQTFAAANGCDSIVTLHLTVKQPVYYEFEAEECPGYIWNGSTYTMSGDYVQTFIGSNECDSVVTLHLTVKESPYSEFTVVACDSYVWDGIEYDADGNYSHTYEAVNGCDSTVVMLLTVNESPTASITGDLWVATNVQDSTVLTAWGDGTYLWSTGDTTQSITVAPNIETTYYVTVTNENGCSATAEATVINSTGINENVIDINVYPNPTKQVINIEAEEIRNVRVSDMLGQVLIDRNASGDRVQIDLSTYAAGQYFLQVYTANGTAVRKIVKK